MVSAKLACQFRAFSSEAQLRKRASAERNLHPAEIPSEIPSVSFHDWLPPSPGQGPAVAVETAL